MYWRRSIPSLGIAGFNWNGRHVTRTWAWGPSKPMAFSKRRLPTQHHGQITSETTSTSKARFPEFPIWLLVGAVRAGFAVDPSLRTLSFVLAAFTIKSFP